MYINSNILYILPIFCSENVVWLFRLLRIFKCISEYFFHGSLIRLLLMDNCNQDHGSFQQHDIFDFVENPDVLERRRSSNFY